MAFGAVEITVIGNLAEDVQLSYTPGGKAVAKFPVLQNTRVKGQDGRYVDGEPSRYFCVAWEGLAENIAGSIQKGSRVIVQGAWSQRSYEKAPEVEGGQPERRTVWELKVEACGPDLRYATAKVQKLARASQGNVPADDAWATASPNRPS